MGSTAPSFMYITINTMKWSLSWGKCVGTARPLQQS